MDTASDNKTEPLAGLIVTVTFLTVVEPAAWSADLNRYLEEVNDLKTLANAQGRRVLGRIIGGGFLLPRSGVVVD